MSSYFDMSEEEYRSSVSQFTTKNVPQPAGSEQYLTDVISSLPHPEFNLITDQIKHMYISFYYMGPLCPILRTRDGEVVVVYTESDDKLQRELRTVGKLGRLLRRIAKPNVSDRTIELMVDAIRAKFTSTTNPSSVKFAITADDIRRVYIGGPSSCMDSQAWNNRDQYHPCMSYAYPSDRTEIVPDSGNSIAVAYVGSIDNAEARAVVNTERKQYYTVYGGMKATLTALLNALGYTENCYFLNNQKLALVHSKSRGSTYLPYLDGCRSNVDINSDHILVSGNGEYSISSSGYVDGPAREQCYECEEWFDEDDTTNLERYERTVCHDCLHENYTYAIVRVHYVGGRQRHVRDYVENDDVITVGYESYLEENASECGLRYCDKCEEWFDEDDVSCIGNDEDSYDDVIDETEWDSGWDLCPMCYAQAIEDLNEARRKLEESKEEQGELCLV